jgi:hypothetical protein
VSPPVTSTSTAVTSSCSTLNPDPGVVPMVAYHRADAWDLSAMASIVVDVTGQ